ASWVTWSQSSTVQRVQTIPIRQAPIAKVMLAHSEEVIDAKRQLSSESLPAPEEISGNSCSYFAPRRSSSSERIKIADRSTSTLRTIGSGLGGDIIQLVLQHEVFRP